MTGFTTRLKRTPAYAAWKRGWQSFMTWAPVWRTRRFVRQILGTELRHRVQLRGMRLARAGEWRYAPALLDPGGVAYCFGVGDEIDLELALVREHRLEVHAFDPTPRAVEWIAGADVPEGLRFHAVGVAGHDGTATFHPPASAANPSFSMVQDRTGGAEAGVEAPVRRLSTLAGELGHERLALLKLDVEGVEYAALDDLLDAGLDARQILVEFHHRFRGIGRAATARAVERLNAAGWRIVHISASGREYSFVRVDGGGAR